jgi:S1-C subfamily serine protease
MRSLPTYLRISIISFYFTGYAAAQQILSPPTGEMLTEGIAINAPGLSVPLESPAYNDITGKEVFGVLSDIPATERRTRGPHEVALFASISPSVVLISTNNAMGSGSVISGGLILTNWHVVGDASFVGILYKPAKIDDAARANMVVARVIKIDQIHDLALLKPTSMSSTAKPIELGDREDVQVGADVHAIGHPLGQAWSYTKGVISQIRNDFSWLNHRANVIQTQTPINLGNSGGPLLSDEGKLIGVNSFLQPEGQGLNFAVSIIDVRNFLTAPSSKAVPAPKAEGNSIAEQDQRCAPKLLFEGRNKDGNAYIRRISLRCDGFADLIILLPDDTSKPMMALLDSKHRNKPDGYVLDATRAGKWQVSYWDVDFDDTFPLKGIHENGGIKPVRFERRCPGKAGTNFRCL